MEGERIAHTEILAEFTYRAVDRLPEDGEIWNLDVEHEIVIILTPRFNIYWRTEFCMESGWEYVSECSCRRPTKCQVVHRWSHMSTMDVVEDIFVVLY